MSNLRHAAIQALEALEWVWGGEPLTGKELDAIAALRQALAEPEQEPVAWMDREGDVYKELPSPNWCPPHTPLYAHSSTPRKPLTDEEIDAINREGWFNILDFARAIERAHGITGETK